jgi:uncharacterized SAM-binding protein YcdF (DUF218 family)
VSIRKVIWSTFGCLTVWFGGLVWFTGQIPQTKTDPTPADAIVILTGGKGRLDYGLSLLVKGKGRIAFISGVHGINTPAALTRILPAGLQSELGALPPDAITLGREAENTIGNAEETVGWGKTHRIHSLILVTSNYHMPRALSEFKQIMPLVTVIPAPSFDGYDIRLLLSEYHKYLASKFRHWLVSTTES